LAIAIFGRRRLASAAELKDRRMNQFSAPASTTEPPLIAAKDDAFELLQPPWCAPFELAITAC